MSLSLKGCDWVLMAGLMKESASGRREVDEAEELHHQRERLCCGRRRLRHSDLQEARRELDGDGGVAAARREGQGRSHPRHNGMTPADLWYNMRVLFQGVLCP